MAKRFGFHRAKIPLVSCTKHGSTSLLIPGYDPPLNITIFGDISINPGLETLIQNNLKRRNENLPNILDLHMITRVTTYTRAELLGIRRASRSFVCGRMRGLGQFRNSQKAFAQRVKIPWPFAFLAVWHMVSISISLTFMQILRCQPKEIMQIDPHHPRRLKLEGQQMYKEQCCVI